MTSTNLFDNYLNNVDLFWLLIFIEYILYMGIFAHHLLEEKQKLSCL